MVEQKTSEKLNEKEVIEGTVVRVYGHVRNRMVHVNPISDMIESSSKL